MHWSGAIRIFVFLVAAAIAAFMRLELEMGWLATIVVAAAVFMALPVFIGLLWGSFRPYFIAH